MIEARDITVHLGKRQILKEIGFIARPGQVSSVVGPNGSGKTTLLRALTGEIECNGEITVNGRALRQIPHWQLAGMRAVLPQSTALAFPFNVIEVIHLGLPARRSYPLALKALSRVGLAGYEQRPYQELSGGEKQRVQLARVLAQISGPTDQTGPRWLFLDEPVSALDIGHQLQIMRLAREFADAGGGVVAIMHDLNLTAMFSDQITLLKDGAVLGTGRPEDTLTDSLLSRAYDCPLRVGFTPPQVPFVLPQSAGKSL
ncbi:heme ABC transporter ATP-binding protein [Sulfitobacter sp. BDSS02]|nr:heme ABC transporter ATP-binding protein [Sulfitobacter sp. BDSS02]MBR9852075.1 heme ABC transporter ATP-binding protein [Paracoccaceae bacterium]